MFQSIVIGNVGGEATTKTENGKQFTTFRVAHNDVWKDANGVEHSEVQWIDCIMNDRPKVADFLKSGTLVFVMGNARVRLYSSAKDRCMKAGCTINVRQVELLGGKRDEIPTRLYDTNGVQHDVTKYYWTDLANAQLMTMQGVQFVTDANGWISKVADPAPQEATAASVTTEQGTQQEATAASVTTGQVTQQDSK